MHFTQRIFFAVFLAILVGACAPLNIADEGIFADNRDLKRLIAAGEDVNFQDKDGDSALINAVMHGNLESVKLLLEAGADVSLKNKDGDTALGSIGLFDNSDDAEILALLLAHDADINSTNVDGETALFYAVAFGYENLVEVLLSSGADVSLKNTNGETPLWMNCTGKENNVAILDLLLSQGADINARDFENDTVAALVDCQEDEPLMTYMKSVGLE